MKKVFIILLTFFIIMSVGCTKDNKIKDSTISNSSSLTSNSQTASVIETEKQPYEDIKCFIPSGFKNIYVKSPNDSLSLNLSLPKEWSITKSASALQIRRDGKNIGEIVAGIPKESRTSLYEYNTSFLGVEVIHNIYRTSDSSFEHVFNYIYKNENSKKREFTLKTRYEEVSKNTTIRIVDYATTTPAKTEDNIGALKLTDNRKKILILGNSFINSSILQSLCVASLQLKEMLPRLKQLYQLAKIQKQNLQYSLLTTSNELLLITPLRNTHPMLFYLTGKQKLTIS